MKQTQSSFDIYKEKMKVILTEYNQDFVESIPNEDNATDYDKVVVGLWRIINYNLVSILDNIHDRRYFYSVAGSARHILESVATIHYLSTEKPKYAKKFWNNQQKISKDLKENGWQAFVGGSVNKYGNLSFKKDMLQKIEDALGKDALGSYNFLCFFTHPNMASYFWIDADKDGKHAVYLLQVVTQLIAKFFDMVEKNPNINIKASPWLRALDKVFTEYLKSRKAAKS